MGLLLSLAHATAWQIEGGARSFMQNDSPSALPSNRISSRMLPRQNAGLAFPSAAIGEGQG